MVATRRKGKLLRRSWLGLAVLVLALAGWSWWAARDALVVYCAHDSIHAEAILREFERRTGIPVQVRYDTEATKSLGLVELISRERARPRCDVFWNNELLGTLRLMEEGLLLGYRGPGFARIPPRFKDPEGRWVGFAGRLRVWIWNTERLEDSTTPPAGEVARRLAAGDLSRVAIAKPLYGTTRTHYTALWHAWGRERLLEWHRQWRAARVREVSGNRNVAVLVATGRCDIGLTDTDDYFLERHAGRPVAQAPVRLADGRTLCIPNTVAILRTSQRIPQARQLVDFLLSEAGEIALARSRARQLPLGPVDPNMLPPEVRRLMVHVDHGCDLVTVGVARNDCLDWLRGEYLR